MPVTVVTLPLAGRTAATRAAELADAIVADVAATAGFSEVHYDAAGSPPGAGAEARSRTWPTAAPNSPLGPGDVLLVTGGGKGITAECALALAQRDRRGGRPARPVRPRGGRGAGRQPGPDGRGRRRGTATSGPTSPPPRRSRRRSRRSARDLGPVTAVLHGAGRNEPVALASLDEAAFQRDPGAEDRRPGGGAGRGRPGLAEAAGHLRQHHRPGRAARRGGLRHRQRLADRPDQRGCSEPARSAGAWRWSGRSGPAPAWASGSACWSR